MAKTKARELGRFGSNVRKLRETKKCIQRCSLADLRMLRDDSKKRRWAFAIFENTVCDGVVPAWRDEKGFPITYSTQREAEIEIAVLLIDHLRQFIAGERDFDDACTTGDFILPVAISPDGTVQTQDGRRFGKQETWPQ